MTMYAIKKNGEIIKQIVFIGDTSKMHTRPSEVIDLTFDNVKSATEVANHMDAIVVKVA